MAEMDVRDWTPADGDRRCQECGRPNPAWYAANHVWNRVMGGLEATDDPGGVLCPLCFIRRAESEGIAPRAWRLVAEHGSKSGSR